MGKKQFVKLMDEKLRLIRTEYGQYPRKNAIAFRRICFHDIIDYWIWKIEEYMPLLA